MKQFEKSNEKRQQKIAEKFNLERRKQVKDKRYHVIDDEDDEYSELEKTVFREFHIKGQSL